ncbi:MAG: penicillin-binding protein activator [Bdellovibrionales bacterium]|nr:penicillin-binding protein activator [Bdellovibrionales bacterium]
MKQIRSFCFVGLLLFIACKPPTTATQITQEEQQQATVLYNQAESLLQKGQVEEAYKTFESVFTQYPRANVSDNALLRGAQIKANQKDFPKALEFLDQLVHTYPESDIKDHALRDQAYIYHMQENCDRMMSTFFSITLDQLPEKDQAKLNSRSESCIEKNNKSQYALILQLKKYEGMQNNNPLFYSSQQKIIESIDQEKDEKFLTSIAHRYKKNFPAGYASYRMIQLANEEGNKRKVEKWSSYFQENFPLHPKSEKVFDLAQTTQMDTKSNAKKIGVLLPLSGSQKQVGQLILNGLMLAIGTFDQAPQENGIELIVEDTASDPDIARQRIKKLIFTDEVIAVIGPITSKETESVADLAAAVNLPLITMSPKEDITMLADTVFRNSITKKEQAIALAQLTNQVLDIHRVAVLYPETSYGQEFLEIFWKEFEKYGGTVQGAEGYANDQTHFAQPIQKLVGLYPLSLRKDELCSKRYSEIWYDKKKKGLDLPNCFPQEELPPIIDFEAILIPDGPTKARQILPALKYHDVRGVQALGTNLWNTPDLLRGTTGGEMEGALFLDAFYIGKKSPTTQNFVQKFYSHFGYEPSVLEAQAYDSLAFMMDILRSKNISSRSKLVQEMLKKENYEGVTGLTSFSQNREAVRKLTALMVSKDKIVELY